MPTHDFTSTTQGEVENVFGRRLQLVSTNPDIYVEVGATGAVPGITPGTVFWYAGLTAPAYALECDGSEYSESVYAQLFTAIGSTFNTGGETAGYFRVPNISGGSGVNRFIRGADGTMFSVGDTGVDAAPDIDGSFTINRYDNNGDTFRASSGAITLSAGSTEAASVTFSSTSRTNRVASFAASADDSTYSDSATEVTPQYIALLPCIAFTDFFADSIALGYNIGEFFWWPGDEASVPGNALVLDGSEVSRATYAKLWNVIDSKFNPQGSPTEGEFGTGDGSTTFDLMDLMTNNRFIRAADGTTLNVGDVQTDGAPDIDGTVEIASFSTSTSIVNTASGALSISADAGATANSISATGTASRDRLEFSASADDPGTYSDSNTEVVPVNVAMLPCIRAL